MHVYIMTFKTDVIVFIVKCHDVFDVILTNNLLVSYYYHESCDFEPRLSDVNSIQHYMIKFVSDLQKVGDFLRVLRFPPPIKLTATI